MLKRRVKICFTYFLKKNYDVIKAFFLHSKVTSLDSTEIVAIACLYIA